MGGYICILPVKMLQKSSVLETSVPDLFTGKLPKFCGYLLNITLSYVRVYLFPSCKKCNRKTALKTSLCEIFFTLMLPKFTVIYQP